ncbi:MAG: SPOR domain-containing protein [Pseudomonadota bacterium]
MLQRNADCKMFSHGASASGVNLRAVLGVVGLLFVAGCASGPGGEAASVTGESVNDVNWTFADQTAMESKLAALKSENKTLKGKIVALERQLGAVEEAAELAVAEAEAAAAAAAMNQRGGGIGPAPQPVAEPVISAPSADVSESDAPLPVETAPRLVQPTFASAEPSFQNEAQSDGIATQSVLWGVHLDSYKREAYARRGWSRLQRRYPDELGLLEPRLETVMIEGKGRMLRLIGGAFASEATAKALCETLKVKEQYCRVVDFGGRTLAIGEAS